MQNDTHPPPRLIPVTDWVNHHDWPSVGGLRHLVFNADHNGFDKVVKRAGRRVLIDEQAFFNWIGLEEDRSLGAHNPAYFEALLDNSIEALTP